MPRSSYSSVAIDVDTEARPLPLAPSSDTPFRILLLGDFSGRANRGEPAPERLRPYLIDRDNFDEVLARVRPELELGKPGHGMVFRFRELEDFHPDRIYQQHALFRKLREDRRAPSVAPQVIQPPSPPPPPTRLPPAGSLLDDILDIDESSPADVKRPPDALRDFIDRAVAPHLAPREDPRLSEAIGQTDAAAAKLMRALLHHSDFQALEAAWRAVYWLVRGIETGPELKIYVQDLSKIDLAGGLGELHRLLLDQPWTLVAGDYTFWRTESDIRLLGELASIMQSAGSPFLAGALPGAESDESERLWQTLRRSPHASSLGLALPRFLLRLPYGADTDSLESFAFEEMPGVPVHREYLWGNPAFACAYLLGQTFAGGPRLEIEGLPLHVYEEDGEKQLTPCAEILMTESDAESMVEQGYMPLASIKDRDAVRLVRFQSIADPPAPLAGRWR